MSVALNPFYSMAALYLTMGALAALEMVLSYLGIVPSMPGLLWVRVHTIVLGGIAQVIFGTLPRLLASKVGVATPDRATHWRLWGLLNVGIFLAMLGMVTGQMYIFGAGAVGVLLAVLYLLAVVWQLGSQGTGEGRLMARFYAAALFFLVLGITMALTKQLGWPPAPAGAAGAREAHIHANAWGFLDIVFAVSLFQVMPRILGRPLVNLRVMSWVWWGMVIGDLLLVVGPWAGSPVVTVAGLIPYGLAVFTLYGAIVATVIKARPANPAAGWQLVASLFWLVLPAALAPFVQIIAPKALPLDRIEVVAVQSLISGWALQLAMVAIPAIIVWFQSGKAPVSCSCKGKKIVSWAALVANNVGCALFWVAGLMVPQRLFAPVLAMGYLLVLLAWIPFLGRTWKALTQSAAETQGAI